MYVCGWGREDRNKSREDGSGGNNKLCHLGKDYGYRVPCPPTSECGWGRKHSNQIVEELFQIPPSPTSKCENARFFLKREELHQVLLPQPQNVKKNIKTKKVESSFPTFNVHAEGNTGSKNGEEVNQVPLPQPLWLGDKTTAGKMGKTLVRFPLPQHQMLIGKETQEAKMGKSKSGRSLSKS